MTEDERQKCCKELEEECKDEERQEQAMRELTSVPGGDDLAVRNPSRPHFLPQNDDSADPGSTTMHIYNLFYGPNALRVSTWIMKDLECKIFALKGILNALNAETAANASSETLRDFLKGEKNHLVELCIELGVFSDSPLQDAENKPDREDWLEEHRQQISRWTRHTDVKFPKKVRDMLGKTWVFLGSDVQGPDEPLDMVKQRVYIRKVCNSWAEGRPGVIPEMHDETLNWLRLILEPFDAWLPCDMLDEECCISDIPGQ
jgi:hypothetical protein